VRRFDTSDSAQVLQAVASALQDSGFTLEETQTELGVLTATKLTGNLIRVQVVVHRLPQRAATTVRATFQRVSLRRGATPAVGDVLDDPLLYRDFFERVSQSLFLSANEI